MLPWLLPANEVCLHPPLPQHFQLMSIFKWSTATWHNHRYVMLQADSVTSRCFKKDKLQHLCNESGMRTFVIWLHDLKSTTQECGAMESYLNGCFSTCVVKIQSLLVVFRWHPVSGVQMAFRLICTEKMMRQYHHWESRLTISVTRGKANRRGQKERRVRKEGRNSTSGWEEVFVSGTFMQH